jgi:hypothetical protein
VYYEMLYEVPLFDPGDEPDEGGDHELWCITFGEPAS